MPSTTFNNAKWDYDTRLEAAVYSTVSEVWRTEIEQHTFASLRLKTPAHLAEFNRIVRGRLRSFVRCICLDARLDTYKYEGRLENEQEKEFDNQMFTRTLQDLFGILRSWHKDKASSCGILLAIKTYSPSDLVAMPAEE